MDAVTPITRSDHRMKAILSDGWPAPRPRGCEGDWGTRIAEVVEEILGWIAAFAAP